MFTNVQRLVGLESEIEPLKQTISDEWRKGGNHNSFFGLKDKAVQGHAQFRVGVLKQLKRSSL